MKKLTLVVLCVLFLLMTASCVDYSTMTELVKSGAQPEASEEPMVLQSAYTQLLDTYNQTNEDLKALQEEQAASALNEQALTEENAGLSSVTSDVELSVYRSVISKETLGAFFGMVTNAQQTENGDVVLTVQPLYMVNEAMDASQYDKDVIKEIYTGLTLAATDGPEANYTITKETMTVYGGETYYTRDSGFYTYITEAMTSAGSLYNTNSAANPTLLPGPVFIFLAIGDDVIMVLEK